MLLCLQNYKAIATQIDLPSVCQQFASVRYYRGVVDIVLTAASKRDPQCLALHYYINNRQNTDIQGAHAYNIRFVYNLIASVRVNLILHFSGQFLQRSCITVYMQAGCRFVYLFVVRASVQVSVLHKLYNYVSRANGCPRSASFFMQLHVYQDTFACQFSSKFLTFIFKVKDSNWINGKFIRELIRSSLCKQGRLGPIPIAVMSRGGRRHGGLY